MKKWLAFLIFLETALNGVAICASLTLESSASHILLMDAATGSVLLDKHAQELMHPSSMTKILTVYVILNKIKQGKLRLGDTFTVSQNAQSMEGSRMFLKAGSSVKVEDLLRGIIVQSGNDACVVVAEALAGNERAFAEEMTQVARNLGAKNTQFVNSSGLPDERHKTTAYDLALITLRLIQDFPEFYPLFSEKEFTYNNIRQGNRNPLLYKSIGADGVKTGSSEIAGYGMVASAKQGERRLILVINGLKTMNERSHESEKVLAWGFREFDNYTLFHAHQLVDNIALMDGVKDFTSVASPKDIILTLPRDEKDKVVTKIITEANFVAPIKKGQVLAKLVVKPLNQNEIVFNLAAVEDVPRASFFKRLMLSVKRLIWGTPNSVPLQPASKAAP